LDSDAAAALVSLFAPESNPSATGTTTEAPVEGLLYGCDDCSKVILILVVMMFSF
jgi:hypothetical protein